MVFNPMPTQNWTRAFQVWIEDIHIKCQPIIKVPLQASVLGRVRSLTRYSSVAVMLLFALHCSRPVANPAGTDARTAALLPSATESAPEVFTEAGNATWYGGNGDGFRGRHTASGDVFKPEAFTCAHRTLPFGTLIAVENVRNHQRTIVRVNDRGPFIRGRMLDLSWRAAKELGFLSQGVARVRIHPLHPVRAQAEAKANPYTIQLAGSSDALRVAREFKGAFGPVSLREAIDRDGRTLQRVNVGSYGTMEDAQKAADRIGKRLMNRDVEPFITRRF